MDTAALVRQERGLRIAQAKRIKAVGPVWVVPSETHGGSYVVTAKDKATCTCPDYELRREPCKHVFAVEYVRHQVIAPDGTKVVTEAMRVTYRQDWSAYNAGQMNEKPLVQAMLKGLCDGIVAPEQTRGRPRLAPSDVVYAAAMKVYSGVSGRRATADVRAAEARGHVEHAPHYNSISAALDRADLEPVLKALIEESALPLKAIETAFSVDSTGFSTSVYERWYDHKYGKKRKAATWLKAHAMVGNTTNIITSVEITPGEANDSPQFPGLVANTARGGFAIAEVSGDKAYLSNANIDAVERVGGTPYIPFKINSRPGTHEGWQRLWHTFHLNRRTFIQRYHQRSNVEATFSMIKRKLGGSVRSKKYQAQVNEVLLKVLLHNLMVLASAVFELGIEPTFWAETPVCPEKGPR
jgi:transposase